MVFALKQIHRSMEPKQYGQLIYDKGGRNI